VKPFLLWKSNKYNVFWVCIFSPKYPARNAHAPYCHLWPAPLYTFSPHYLINGTTLKKCILPNTKCVFWCSLQLVSEIFPIIRKTERDVIKSEYWSSCKVPVILIRFSGNLDFSRQIFKKKYSKYQISLKPSSWEPTCSMRTDGHTDKTTWHDDADSRFSQFPESAYKKGLQQTGLNAIDRALVAQRREKWASAKWGGGLCCGVSWFVRAADILAKVTAGSGPSVNFVTRLPVYTVS